MDGVFPALYQALTGWVLPVGTRLLVRRLLGQIPEIGEQITTLHVATPRVDGLVQLLAADKSTAWAVLALTGSNDLESDTATGRYVRGSFHRVDAPPDWRDRFALNHRGRDMQFYESNATVPYICGNPASLAAAFSQARDIAADIKDVLSPSHLGMFDAWLAPSLYRSRMVPLSPALARYAVGFYASSLVHYRPSLFDTEVSPGEAYLFDALARESAVPMLLDTLAVLTKTDYHFYGESYGESGIKNLAAS